MGSRETDHSDEAEYPICVQCGLPVVVNRELYEVFERMHWTCFHFSFEHRGDPDKPCTDPSCPWWRIEVYERRLRALGHDPGAVISEAIDERYHLTLNEDEEKGG